MQDDVAAEVKDRQGEEVFGDQEKTVEHPTGAAVAVGEGMDRFELVVCRRHPDQGIEFGMAVEEIFPIREQVPEVLLAYGRGVNQLAAAITGERGAGNPAHPHLQALDSAANFFRRPCAQGPLLQGSKAFQQGLAVAQCLLGRRVREFSGLTELEQPVGGGDDVLDLRTGPRLEQRQGVDQHALVRQ